MLFFQKHQPFPGKIPEADLGLRCQGMRGRDSQPEWFLNRFSPAMWVSATRWCGLGGGSPSKPAAAQADATDSSSPALLATRKQVRKYEYPPLQDVMRFTGTGSQVELIVGENPLLGAGSVRKLHRLKSLQTAAARGNAASFACPDLNRSSPKMIFKRPFSCAMQMCINPHPPPSRSPPHAADRLCPRLDP